MEPSSSLGSLRSEGPEVGGGGGEGGIRAGAASAGALLILLTAPYGDGAGPWQQGLVLAGMGGCRLW